MIDEEMFIKYMGRHPQDDDLERVNCDKEGEPLHRQCGWCYRHNLPRFLCGCLADCFSKETQP